MASNRYRRVNGTWPEGSLPDLDPQEAMSAARRLYRKGTGKVWRGKFAATSGRRYSTIRRGTFFVNAGRGWHALVHDLSHLCHYRLNPTRAPHDFRHAHLERELIEYVVASGWLDGKLRRPERTKAPVDPRADRYRRVSARLASWVTKRKRAETAIRKLQAAKRRYERLGIGA